MESAGGIRRHDQERPAALLYPLEAHVLDRDRDSLERGPVRIDHSSGDGAARDAGAGDQRDQRDQREHGRRDAVSPAARGGGRRQSSHSQGKAEVRTSDRENAPAGLTQASALPVARWVTEISVRALVSPP